MKKLAIGAVSIGVLAVAGALATSYYVGGRIEQAIEQTADSWAEGSGVTVQVMDYERGIISSKATTLWSIATEDDTYEITAKHDILHGPWPMGKAAKVVSRFLLPEGTDPALVKALEQRAPLEWTALADWSGATSNHMESPSFKAAFEDGSALTWGGLQMEWTMSAEMDATKGFARMPAVQTEEQDGSRMEMSGAELRFDARIPQGYSFWLGSSAMQLEHLNVRDATDESTVSVQGVEIKSVNQLKQELLSSDMSLHVKELQSPSFSTKNILLQIQANNINAPWFEQWMGMMQTAGSTDEQVNQLIETLPLLLEGKPELQIQRLSMDSSDGPVALSAFLRYVGEQPQAFDPAMDMAGQVQLSMPVQLIKLIMDGRVRNDYVQLLEQMGSEVEEEELQAAVEKGVQQRLQMLIDNGVLKQGADGVSATLSFSEGEFKLNEQPQTLQQLLSIGSVL